VENYFNYFTEIDEHFHRRRGTTLLLSTLDWALIETWKDAGIPLEAVLRGIDSTFEHYQQRPRTRKINALAYCSQEVLTAAEEMKEAAVGATPSRDSNEAGGLAVLDIAAFLSNNAASLENLLVAATTSERLEARAERPPKNRGTSVNRAIPTATHTVVQSAAHTLRQLAAKVQATGPDLQDVERRLTVLEEKLLAVLLASTPDDELVAVRAEAERELAPYRRKMPGMQIEQLQKQFVHKRLLERYGLPRLSLFYM